MRGDSEMHLPCPLFEGSEKRIEVGFAFGASTPVNGLRSLSREQLDGLMSQVWPYLHLLSYLALLELMSDVTPAAAPPRQSTCAWQHLYVFKSSCMLS